MLMPAKAQFRRRQKSVLLNVNLPSFGGLRPVSGRGRSPALVSNGSSPSWCPQTHPDPGARYCERTRGGAARLAQPPAYNWLATELNVLLRLVPVNVNAAMAATAISAAISAYSIAVTPQLSSMSRTSAGPPSRLLAWMKLRAGNLALPSTNALVPKLARAELLSR